MGEEKHHLHSRHELGIIINEHIGASTSELDEDEVEIIKSALQLSEKHVRDIMTDISSVFWVQPDYVIDGRTIRDIKRNGHSRIPVFNAERTHCYGVLLVKELIDMDFDEEPHKVSELSLHFVKPVGSKTALDTLFRKFIGARTHLMPVERDDVIIGIVTIEDLIEEILGHEIEDETDRQKAAA
jgi:metal transporter CNNM